MPARSAGRRLHDPAPFAPVVLLQYDVVVL